VFQYAPIFAFYVRLYSRSTFLVFRLFHSYIPLCYLLFRLLSDPHSVLSFISILIVLYHMKAIRSDPILFAIYGVRYTLYKTKKVHIF
jgi:hypothetical protein